MCVYECVCPSVCVCAHITMHTTPKRSVHEQQSFRFVSKPGQKLYERCDSKRTDLWLFFFFLFSVCLDQYRKDDQRKHLTTTFPPIFASFTSEGSIVTCCVFLGGFSKLKFTHPLGCILVLDSACHHECFVSISVTNALERNLKVWNVSLPPQKQLPGRPVLVVVKQ